MAIDEKELGKAIAEVRGLRGLTQRQLADGAGLTVNYISLLENAERSVSIDTLNRLADVLKVPAEWILFLGGKSHGRSSDPAFTKLARTTKEAMRAYLSSKRSFEDAPAAS